MVKVINYDPTTLRPSPANKRRFHADDSKDPTIVSLAENIRHDGQIEPIIVRRLPDGVREIVCGERRTRACRLLGIDVMAIERDLDDKRAGMMTAAENAQRENLNPIEEAETLEGLHALGWTHAEIADHLKVPLSHVVRRAQLTKLSPKWREVSTQPDSVVHAWRGPHYEKIARFPADVQDSILVDIGDYEGAAGFTVKELSHYLARFLHSIEHAPWKKDDEALVPGVTSCVACKERSDIQPDLFDADDFVETDGYGNPKKGNKKPGARCLNHACWDRKMLAHTQNVEAQLRTEHKDVVVIAEYPYGLPDNSPFKKKAERHYDYREAKQGDKGAKPVVYVDGARIGQTGWVVPNSGGHNAYNTKPKTTGKAKPLKERRAQLDILRSRLSAGYVVERIEAIIEADKAPGCCDSSKMLATVLTFGCNDISISTKKIWDQWSNAVSAKSIPELISALFLLSLENVITDIRSEVNSSSLYKKPVDRELVEGACELLGIDYDEIWVKVCDEKPEPKTWAKLEAEEKAAKKPSKPKAAAKSKAKPKAKLKVTESVDVDDDADDDIGAAYADERIGTRWEGDDRVNRHGVWLETETIHFKTPKGLKMNISLAGGVGGEPWCCAKEIKTAKSHSSGPCSILHDLFKTRDEAIEAAVWQLRTELKHDTHNKDYKPLLKILDAEYPEPEAAPQPKAKAKAAKKGRAA